ncbi:response regulator [Spirosoma sp. KCTC 42546]|uniref:hybrid sensor histidine kinase/response regulator transcription factor n=1 Tax=Spirosoma sp. KCTC 42546 TaxID=2520506 RepID=UPI00115775C6|nr:hybrid sensor histidine kinase/response regulator transcription factor [Spirosoma sp. KCTC 42546]QDK82220.1 response regulator [Spirosoma sp. KCTC 42546]
MVRPYLLLLALIPFLQGFAQPYRFDSKQVTKALTQPIVNQFEHLSVKDGLSNNSVNCILQDREGFMWFGTNEGLNKYDGHTFTVWQPDPGNPTHSFQNSHITGLCEDRSNRLWAITEGGGLYELNKQSGLVTPHLIQASKAHRWNNQLSIYEDRQGVLWISTFAGLARYEPEKRSFTLYPAPQLEVPVKTVFEDRQHRFWVATNRGLYLFDRATGRFTPIPFRTMNDAQPAFISVYLDAQDVLWLGTATAGYSLFKLDLRRQPWQLVPYNPGNQLNSFVFLNSIHQDAQGIVWVGTTSGLQAIDPGSEKVFTYRPDPGISKGISSNNAQAVYHDRAGTLWVGTDNGIDRQAITTKPFKTYQVIPNKGQANLPENRVNAVLQDNHGQLWLSNLSTVYRMASGKSFFESIPPKTLGSIGQHKNYPCAFLSNGSAGIWIATTDGLYAFDQASGRYTSYPSEVPAQFVERAPTGDLWIGGEGGVASFNPHTHQYTYYKYEQSDSSKLPDRYVHGLLTSRTGDVWILVEHQGILQLNPKTGQTIHYKAGLQGQLTSNDVQAIYEDKDGIIWIGTHLGGLNKFDHKTGLFTTITKQHGIRGNSVVGITSDNAGAIWISTDKGLSKIDPRTNAVRNYELYTGLPSNDFLQNAVCRHNNQLFFGSLNGIVQFNPDSIRDDTRPFPVYITALKVLDKPQPVSNGEITLKHDENFLSFEFAALAYALPEQNQYAYQLIGVDKNWVQNGNRYVANYTNLSPGSYTFRVKAANSDGIWNTKGASIRLVIRPPWWATWWAYSFYALLAAVGIRSYFRFYTNRIRQRQELELNRREAEQLKVVDELKTRFFSNITHELRTPLSLILTPVEKLLQGNRLDNSTSQTLALVQRNANQLLRLINQLLDLSKLEANSMPVSFMRGEVSEFVSQLVDSFRPAAEQKGITLQYTADELPPEQLFDADKWEKILTNLLSNALKFTGAGGTIQVTLKPDASVTIPETPRVLISVKDSGIGISSDNLPHIFNRFYQVDYSSTRHYEGTGIGLSLVKELVDLVGGAIYVDSQPGVGTTFSVTLPVRPLSDDIQAPAVGLPDRKHTIIDQRPIATKDLSENQSIAEEGAPRMLIVEDNVELREFLIAELAQTYQVLSADNGEEGWKLAQAELPDIVISDLMMPKMDGYELTRLIKTHPDTDHIAVVILTAKAAHLSRIEGLQEGADDYLAKPFHLDELHLRLHNLITRQQRLRDQYRHQFTLLDTPTPLDITKDPFLHRVYELLDNHLDNPSLNVDWLADQLAMSRKTLYRKVHSLTQLAPNELIRQYRLRKAADLLRSGRNVTETAYLVGLKTPSHFTLVFKEFYHKTPTEFIANPRKTT